MCFFFCRFSKKETNFFSSNRLKKTKFDYYKSVILPLLLDKNYNYLFKSPLTIKKSPFVRFSLTLKMET